MGAGNMELIDIRLASKRIRVSILFRIDLVAKILKKKFKTNFTFLVTTLNYLFEFVKAPYISTEDVSITR